MSSDSGSDHQVAREAAPSPDTTRQPSWPMALASLGVCVGAVAAIALVAMLA